MFENRIFTYFHHENIYGMVSVNPHDWPVATFTTTNQIGQLHSSIFPCFHRFRFRFKDGNQTHQVGTWIANTASSIATFRSEQRARKMVWWVEANLGCRKQPCPYMSIYVYTWLKDFLLFASIFVGCWAPHPVLFGHGYHRLAPHEVLSYPTCWHPIFNHVKLAQKLDTLPLAFNEIYLANMVHTLLQDIASKSQHETELGANFNGALVIIQFSGDFP